MDTLYIVGTLCSQCARSPGLCLLGYLVAHTWVLPLHFICKGTKCLQIEFLRKAQDRNSRVGSGHVHIRCFGGADGDRSFQMVLMASFVLKSPTLPLGNTHDHHRAGRLCRCRGSGSWLEDGCENRIQSLESRAVP